MTVVPESVGGPSTSSSSPPSTPSRALRALRDVITLMKPSITAMAAIVAAGGMALAPGHVTWLHAMGSLLGIALAVAGAGALNMWLERDVDGLMERTRLRPLPDGRMRAAWALVIGGGACAIAFPLLAMFANTLTVALTAFSLFVYVLIYTPMKRMSWLALFVGSIPGAMPAWMGAAAVANRVELAGAALFGIVFLWQIPHFLAISIYREKDYVAAGHRVLSAATSARTATLVTVGSAWVLVAFCIALWPLHVAGAVYGVTATLLGVWFSLVATRGLRLRIHKASDRTALDTWARKVFFSSLIYQTVLFGALALDALLTRTGKL